MFWHIGLVTAIRFSKTDCKFTKKSYLERVIFETPNIY